MAKKIKSSGMLATVKVDGDDVRVRVKKMDPRQAREFRRRFRNSGDFPSSVFVTMRKPGEEMAKRPIARPLTPAEEHLTLLYRDFDEMPPVNFLDLPEKVSEILNAARSFVPDQPTDDEFVIDDREIKLRRLSEMTTEQRAQYDAIDKAEEDEAADFTVHTITNYVTVVEGDLSIEDEDGNERQIVSGADLVAEYASRLDILQKFVGVVWRKNFLSNDEKKDSPLPSASAGSSENSNGTSQLETALGGEPATTATSAELKDSATNVDVTASSASD